MTMKVDVFCEMLHEHGAEDIGRAFNLHRRTSKHFPTPADILEYLEPQTVYRCNNGPDGWGAVYDRDHPYIRQQRRLGVDIESYAEQARAVDGIDINRLKLAASAEHLAIEHNTQR